MIRLAASFSSAAATSHMHICICCARMHIWILCMHALVHAWVIVCMREYEGAICMLAFYFFLSVYYPARSLFVPLWASYGFSCRKPLPLCMHVSSRTWSSWRRKWISSNRMLSIRAVWSTWSRKRCKPFPAEFFPGIPPRAWAEWSSRWLWRQQRACLQEHCSEQLTLQK